LEFYFTKNDQGVYILNVRGRRLIDFCYDATQRFFHATQYIDDNIELNASHRVTLDFSNAPHLKRLLHLSTDFVSSQNALTIFTLNRSAFNLNFNNLMSNVGLSVADTLFPLNIESAALSQNSIEYNVGISQTALLTLPTSTAFLSSILEYFKVDTNYKNMIYYGGKVLTKMDMTINYMDPLHVARYDEFYCILSAFVNE
jgi:hypothetical protein